MKKVIIIGAGGYGSVVKELVESAGDTVIGFLDDNAKDVLGKPEDCEHFIDCEFIISIGNAAVRERLSKLNCKWYTAIHPSAVISPSAKIGEGTLVLPGAIISSNARIGRFCIINHGSFVAHDNIIEDYAHISGLAKLGGTCNIGKSTWVGIGATVKNNINICSDCMIGAGAVVVKDINEPGTYVGIPAKQLVKK